MLVSLDWIKEYIDLPEDLSPEQLAHDLTMKTVEVEGIESQGEAFEHMVVGQIVDVAAHPDADKMRVVQTDIGQAEPVTIVCGGTNLAIGQKVAVSLPGAKVRWHGEGEPVEIKPTKLRGVASHGMICAAAEVGLADLLPEAEEHLIMDLSFVDAPAGTPLAKALGLDDTIFEIDNKSMTNRPDLWGHYGIARELAAIYELDLKPLPQVAMPETPGIEVRIEDPKDCARYCALTISGLKNQASPFWLKRRLASVGQRPIDILVDITNYIMLATGQPTHGFDRNHVVDYIEVRRGRAGEQLELLNQDILEVGPDSLLITDAKGVLGLAGVMGGKLDSIEPDTTELILEAANFNPVLIRHSSQKYSERTEASTRFEKGINTQRVDEALGYAAYLFQELQPGCVLEAFSDHYPQATEARQISLDKAFIETRLGRSVSDEAITHVLEKLGFEVHFEADQLTVVAPVWRSSGDIEIKDDILEEIARMLGYAAMEFVPPQVKLEKAVRQPVMDLERKLREYLAFQAQSQEIFSYPWVKAELNQAAGIDGPAVELAAPPAPDQKQLRRSLIPGILGAIDLNAHHFEEFRLFELTQVFFPGEYSPSTPDEVLPQMRRHLAGALVGLKPLELFRQLKGLLEDIPRAVGMEGFRFQAIEQPSWADAKLWLNILLRDQVIGSFGLLSLRAARAAGIKRVQSVLFELDVDALVPLVSRENQYEALSEWPLIEYDISLILDESVAWTEVEAIVAPMVKRLDYVGVFRGKPIPEDKKSLTLRVWFQSKGGTMTMEQVDRRVQAIVKQLSKQLGASVRGMK